MNRLLRDGFEMASIFSTLSLDEPAVDEVTLSGIQNFNLLVSSIIEASFQSINKSEIFNSDVYL